MRFGTFAMWIRFPTAGRTALHSATRSILSPETLKALLVSLAAILCLLASGFTYAHQKIYQRRFERDLMDQSVRALRARPEMSSVSVSFEGLDARLSGTVEEPRHRALAQEILNQVSGARATDARNSIRISPWLKIETAIGSPGHVTGWMPSPAWKDRALLLINPLQGRAGFPLNWDGVQTDPSVTEPVFLNHPTMPGLARAFFSSVTNGIMEIQLTRVKLSGKAKSDSDRAQVSQFAQQIWNGFGGSVVENHLELSPLAHATTNKNHDFSWAGFDMPRVVRSFPFFFDANSAAIKPDESGKAERIAAAIRQLAPQGHFVVKGIADGTGNTAANQRIAQKRADAVVSLLIQRGVRKEQLVARVQTEKLAPPDAKSNEAKRRLRRVELSIP